jgi:hypothetical protein
MQHNELTPLLLVREELQPRSSCKSTLYIQQARTTIVHSPLYNMAVQMFYSDTLPVTYPPSPQTPPLNTPPPSSPNTLLKPCTEIR